MLAQRRMAATEELVVGLVRQDASQNLECVWTRQCRANPLTRPVLILVGAFEKRTSFGSCGTKQAHTSIIEGSPLPSSLTSNSACAQTIASFHRESDSSSSPTIKRADA